jgi:hypothetical protein
LAKIESGYRFMSKVYELIKDTKKYPTCKTHGRVGFLRQNMTLFAACS